MKDTLKYFDLIFFVKFFLILAFLHYFHIFYLGLVTPEGSLYISFLEKYFNYIAWLTTSIVYTANIFDHLIGLPSFIEANTIIIADSASVSVWLPCLGLGVSSLWIAFIVTQDISIKRKIYWSIGGVLMIWMINCWRIALLLLALHKNWEKSSIIDHHDMFNLTAYTSIAVLIYFFYRTKPSISSEHYHSVTDSKALS